MIYLKYLKHRERDTNGLSAEIANILIRTMLIDGALIPLCEQRFTQACYVPTVQADKGCMF